MARELWGDETRKAIANFPISGEPVPSIVIHWLAAIKSAAAEVNAELGLIDGEVAARISAAADAVTWGDHDDQFPVDVFQTGSGTSTNMNVNEVIAHLAGENVHPNDHVNLGQSSNDVFATAVQLATVDVATNSLIPALARLEAALVVKAAAFSDKTKAARTHLMDAVPVTLGQEFQGYGAQVALGIERIESALVRVAQVPLGGTAVGNGLNTHAEFADRIRERLVAATSLPIEAPRDRFEAQSSRDAMVELSGALKVIAVSLTKIANDIAWMASGPRAGLGELTLPELQKGSSIMPGKVNPVLPEVVLQVAAQVIGNDLAVTVGGMQGNFELNARVPLIARNVISSLQLLSTSTTVFAERCVDGITPNDDRLRSFAERTLASATVLNPVVGYDEASEIVRLAERNGLSLREAAIARGVDEESLAEALDPQHIALGNAAPTNDG